MTAAFPRHLHPGHTGRDVTIIKRAIASELHDHTMSVDNPLYGTGTQHAINLYQRIHRITEDGYGLRTHRLLERRFTRLDKIALAALALHYPAFPASGKHQAFATQYGGPRDPSTPGHRGGFGDDLNAHPDSYAELSSNPVNGPKNDYRAIARLLGEPDPLPYLTPIRVTYRGKTIVVYKRDVGFGGPGPDHDRTTLPDNPVIDLWWKAADSIGHNGWAWLTIEVGRH